jgi:glycosyltransferase involved in cell wall biosynthesis
MNLSVIVPAVNEEQSIVGVISDIKKALHDYDYNYEIIVVDDGSTDKTFELAVSQGVRVIQHSHNRGYGVAIRSGIKESKYDWILITDGDGTYPVEEIASFFKFVPEYDMVVGARTGQKVHIPFFRRPAKWFLTRLAGFLVGSRIPDLNSGLRLFRKDSCLEFSHLYPEGFSFTSTLTMAFLTHKYSVKFIPINYYKREGRSSMRAYDFVNFNKLLVRLTLFFKPLKLFSIISVLLFLLALFVFSFSKFYLKRVMDISTIVILMSSLQVFLFGLLAELIVRLREQK